jgi:EpsD family peptidyl-prolyl cis-trans isomerase
VGPAAEQDRDQPAATVDGVAISQSSVISAAPAGDLERQTARLDALIDEQLLVSAALRAGLENEASVVAAAEAGRRQALVRAYLEHKAVPLGPIRSEDIERYYAQHSELFARRRIYRMQEIVISVPPERVDEITASLASLTTFRQRREWLDAKQLPYRVGAVTMAAEELPADLLATVSQLAEGNVFNVRSEQGLTMVQIIGIEDRPLTLAQSRDDIERFLVNQRLDRLAREEAARLRKTARIEYFAPFTGSGRH